MVQPLHVSVFDVTTGTVIVLWQRFMLNIKKLCVEKHGSACLQPSTREAKAGLVCLRSAVGSRERICLRKLKPHQPKLKREQEGRGEEAGD